MRGVARLAASGALWRGGGAGWGAVAPRGCEGAWRHCGGGGAAGGVGRRRGAAALAAGDGWLPALSMRVPGHSAHVDPFRLAARDLEAMTVSVRETVSVLQHPVLDRAASHLFSLHGKRLRPIIVILMGHATAVLKGPAAGVARGDGGAASLLPVPPVPVPPLGPLGDAAAAVGGIAKYVGKKLLRSPVSVASGTGTAILASQLRMAEITEMIHAASLLHDDVIDSAESRRGVATVNSVFGNQLAVLAGDFLLARASVSLARLRDCDVVELLSTVIEHLVRGEVIQMNGADGGAGAGAGMGGIGDASAEDVARQRHYHKPHGVFEAYMAKTFFKTASLMANSCRAVTMLAGHPEDAADAAYAYGEHVGLAFQLVDDMLDYTSSAKTLGKPVLHDLQQGHATAPVLFAMERFPELQPLVSRRFRDPGDVQAAVDFVARADGIAKTRELAASHARTAVNALTSTLPPSNARSALINIADHVISRTR